jgi:hypothetical protein
MQYFNVSFLKASEAINKILITNDNLIKVRDFFEILINIDETDQIYIASEILDSGS